MTTYERHGRKANYETDHTYRCWLWLLKLGNHGYGRINYGGKEDLAHRVSWRAHKGQIPAGMVVCHRCDVRACINPEHLFLGTRYDNSHDMTSKGRQSVGESRWNVKLAPFKVIAIRTDRRPRWEIAAEYGVSESTISRARNNKLWRHIE